MIETSMYSNHKLEKVLTIDSIVSCDYLCAAKKGKTPHSHPEAWELAVCLDGECFLSIGDDTVVLSKKQALFIRPNVIHDIQIPDENSKVFVCAFVLVSSVQQPLDYKIISIHDDSIHLIERIIDELKVSFLPDVKSLSIKTFRASSQAPFGAQQLICDYLEILVINCLRNLILSDSQSKDNFKNAVTDFIINQINQYVEQHLSENLTVEGIAKQFHYSRSRISTIYKTATGKSLNDYITDLRINLATYRLLAFGDSVAKASEYCGFSSPEYFSRVFRSKMGMSPQEYRKLKQGRIDLQQMKPVSDLIEHLKKQKEIFWINPGKLPFEEAVTKCTVSEKDIYEAEERLERFSSYIMKAFPEIVSSHGILESELRQISGKDRKIKGKLFVKLDSNLPISGSIKARGGIYEVLKTAEEIAIKNGYLTEEMSYECFSDERFKELFSNYSIAVGSTGNLGLSIGIMSAKLGFKTFVHMSRDARQWKKDKLRSCGVHVIEYDSDYSSAVKAGREKAKDDPLCHFVDDENSRTLFLGYSVAALRLQKQLKEKGISVDSEHSLYVYLPCGVGGGPGGVAFGIKMLFGEHAHCYFAEPTHSPSMLLGMATGLHDGISVSDIGLDNKTAADGLAVGRPSGFIGRTLQPFIDGCFTVSDDHMYRMLADMADREGIFLEPSALAGMPGPKYVEADENATHIIWATGGGMVPRKEMDKYIKTGRQLLTD